MRNVYNLYSAVFTLAYVDISLAGNNQRLVGGRGSRETFQAMEDSTDGAIFNKCDPVSARFSSSVSLENKLFSLLV